MTARRIPRPRDFAELLVFPRPSMSPTARRLARAQTIDDLRQIAKRVTPRAPFDYADGAAEQELSLGRARQAFRDIEFHPSILRDVSDVDTSCTVTGGPSALPFGLAPTGFTRMLHTEGEKAGAAAAGAAGIPFSLSTVATTTPDDASTTTLGRRPCDEEKQHCDDLRAAAEQADAAAVRAWAHNDYVASQQEWHDSEADAMAEASEKDTAFARERLRQARGTVRQVLDR